MCGTYANYTFCKNIVIYSRKRLPDAPVTQGESMSYLGEKCFEQELPYQRVKEEADNK
jgi:hypothetical protein